MSAEGIDVRLLGPLETTYRGVSLPVTSPRQRAILVTLALGAPAPVSAAALAEALWGERPPASWQHALHVHVAGLRQALGEAGAAVETRPGGYALAVASLDLREFEALVRAGRHEEALALWAGAPDEDVALRAPVASELRRLDDLRLTAIEARAEADLAAGRHAAVADELRALVREEPYRESLWHLLMVALYRCGRPSDALAAARELRAALDELGIVPAPRLGELETAVLRHDPALAPAQRRATPPPVPATPILGREAETGELVALLEDPATRLVTLRGPGGVGKTRLALEIAGLVEHAFPGGVAFAGAAGLSDPALVVPTIAERLGVVPDPGVSVADAVAQELAGRRTLALVDNLEQVVEAAPAVAELLAACPDLVLLATSRTSLDVRGERVYELAPLELPPAVSLFADRVARVRRGPGFSAADEELAEEICRRLDGLPLALELAAARCRLLDLGELAARLDTGLDLDARGGRDTPPRQRTLRDTLEWSEALLGGEARTLLARLGVFAGSFTVAAVEEVCGEVAEALEELVESSFVRHATSPGRLTMLATIRAYAAERLAASPEATELEARHAAWAIAGAEAVRAQLRTGSRREVVDRLYPQLDDLRAALSRLRDAGRADDLLRLAAALEALWHTAGHLREGIAWLDAGLAMEAASDLQRARGLAAAARLAVEVGDVHRAAPLADEARATALRTGDPEALAAAFVAQAGAAYYRGDFDGMRARLAEARPLLEETGDAWHLAFIDFACGSAAHVEGRDAEAAALLERAAEGYARLGEEWGIAAAEMNLAGIELAEGRRDAAATHAARALDRFERLGDRSWALHTMNVLARAVVESDPARALDLGLRSARLALRTHQDVFLADALLVLAEASLELGRPEPSARLRGAAAKARQHLQGVTGTDDPRREDALRRRLEAELGDRADALAAEGACLTPEDALALVDCAAPD